MNRQTAPAAKVMPMAAPKQCIGDTPRDFPSGGLPPPPGGPACSRLHSSEAGMASHLFIMVASTICRLEMCAAFMAKMVCMLRTDWGAMGREGWLVGRLVGWLVGW